MRELSSKIRRITAGAVLALFAGLTASAPARAADSDSFNQKDSQVKNYDANSAGSDDSLRSGVPCAMQALMDLANSKLPSAVKNGYCAYGKYRNAENLDHLKDQNAMLANAMVSAGSEPVFKVIRTDTTFRRLDPSFLRQGEASKISGEFERETGMKREDFLTQMANASEQKIKRSDPMMIDKALSRLEGFLQKIPNAEFRKNAEKNIALVPDTMRRGLVAQAVTKLAGFVADAGSATPPPESTITDLTKGRLASGGTTDAVNASALSAAGAVTDGAKDAGKDSAKDPARDPAAVGGDTLTPAKGGDGSGSGNGKNGVEGVVAAALATQGLDSQGSQGSAAGLEATIFSQVTKRYRILTPQLTKLP